VNETRERSRGVAASRSRARCGRLGHRRWSSRTSSPAAAARAWQRWVVRANGRGRLAAGRARIKRGVGRIERGVAMDDGE
jgi:hypothetical protein